MSKVINSVDDVWFGSEQSIDIQILRCRQKVAHGTSEMVQIKPWGETRDLFFNLMYFLAYWFSWCFNEYILKDPAS